MLCMFFPTCWDRPAFGGKLWEWRKELVFTHVHQYSAIPLQNGKVFLAGDMLHLWSVFTPGLRSLLLVIFPPHPPTLELELKDTFLMLYLTPWQKSSL